MNAASRSQDDIERLGDKLQSLSSHLSDDERALLGEIFAVAAESIGGPGAGAGSDPPAAFAGSAPGGSPVRDQFLGAFAAGAVPDATTLRMKITQPVVPE
ncbi:MAG TPA: hypothetical protein VGD11_07215 [Mycobacteriales bacterium]|nr:hypothetical protein [Mycobacterium sp.]